MVSTRMKCLRAFCLFSTIASTAWSATVPLYQNDVQLFGTPPQIDAVRFVNNSLFYIFYSSTLPYDTSNTRFFTNNGQMYNSSGFRIEKVAGPKRLMMDAFSNSGIIESGSVLSISASNITSPGFLFSGGGGILQVQGKNVDLSNGGLRTGGGQGGVALAGIYSAVGVGNDLSGTNVYTISLKNYQLPSPVSPDHEVGTFGGSLVKVPSFDDGRTFSASVYSNNNTIQIVFYPDSTPELQTQVKFGPVFSSFIIGGGGGVGGRGGFGPIVEFSAPDYDVVTSQATTNFLYFSDASATTTNYFLFSTGNGGTTPSTYTISSFQPSGWTDPRATNENLTYSPSLIYTSSMVTNTITNSYIAYSGQYGPAGSITAGSISNLLGRIEIAADTLNLRGARIKADSGLIISAKNIVDNQFPIIDAPYVSYNVGSTNGKLTLGDVAGSPISRFSGTISAWTGVWYNQRTNANAPVIKYHICIVDAKPNSGFISPSVDTLQATAGHVVINGAADTINNQLTINAKALTVTPTGALGYQYSFSSSSSQGIGSNNFPALYLLTNQGGIYANGVLNLGYDRPKPYSNIVNKATLGSAAAYVRSRILADSGVIVANSGSVSLDVLNGMFASDFILADSSIRINASEMVASNSNFRAGYFGSLGRLELSVTNSLTDYGPTRPNFWDVTAGFSLSRRPKNTSSLLGTTIYTTSGRFQNAAHVWASTNLGAIASGYTNNAAVGRLILDGVGDVFSSFSFSGVGKNSAIYVDYLDFENYATNYASIVSVSPNFTIYFADSNLKAKQLDGALGGRLRWVNSYAGAYSSVTVTNQAGAVFKVNRQLALSTTIDSDGDGIANATDPHPWEYSAPSIFTQPTNKTVNVGATLSVSAVYRGAPPLTYQWSRNGVKVNGATNATLVIPNVQMANAGSYHVVVNNSLGSATSTDAVITVVNPFASRSGSYSGLFGNAASYQFASSGFEQLSVTESGSFSGQIRIEGGSYSLSGKFDPTGASMVQVPRTGKSTLTCQFNMDLVGSNSVTGTVTDGVFNVPASLDRAVFSASRPAPYAGRYTLAIRGASPVNGDGYGTLTISSSGAATFSGSLADGTPVTQTANVSASGRWPVYLPLYTGNGMLISWVQFVTNAPSRLAGTNTIWTKNAVGGKYYPDGFRISSPISGNFYLPPAMGVRVLNLTNATVTLSSGNLGSTITNSAVLGTNNVITVTSGTNNLKLTVTLSSGLVNGSFNHPVTKLVTPVFGVARQGTNQIQGYFLGSDQSGGLKMVPTP